MNQRLYALEPRQVIRLLTNKGGLFGFPDQVIFDEQVYDDVITYLKTVHHTPEQVIQANTEYYERL